MNARLLAFVWPVLALVPYAVLQARFLAGLRGFPDLLGATPEFRASWTRYIARRSLAAVMGGFFWLACTLALSGAVSVPRHVMEPVDSALVSFVLDVSNSMLGDDGTGRRVDAAARLAAAVAAAAEGAELSLVAFRGGPVTLCPPTKDRSAFSDALRWAGPRVTTSAGSDVGAAIDEAMRPALAGGATRVIVVLTDGNDTGSKAREASERAARSGAKLAFAGFGGDRALPVSNADGEPVKSPDGRPAMTMLDAVAMKDWAAAGHGLYVRGDDPDAFSDLASLCLEQASKVGGWRVVKVRVDASPTIALFALVALAMAVALALPPGPDRRGRAGAGDKADMKEPSKKAVKARRSGNV